MGFFNRKRKDDEYEDDDDYEVDEKPFKRIKDLRPENKKKRKEPVKPWGKKERYIVLGVLVGTLFTSAILAVSARDYKLPGLPALAIPKLTFFNPFKEEVIRVGKVKDPNIEKSEKIINGFKVKTNNLSGVYSLYVTDLSTNYSFGVNENKVMQAASLIKLPLMLYSLGKVDDSKIEAMGKRSDNTVFNELVKKFGKDNIQEYIDTLGMVDTSLEENETTPKEMGELFKKIYNEKNEKLLGYMTDTIFEKWLKEGVPSVVRVAHKYGRELHVVNDAGVVYASKPYVVVIMTQGAVETEADSIFPELSRLVYDGMTK